MQCSHHRLWACILLDECNGCRAELRIAGEISFDIADIFVRVCANEFER